MESRARWSNLLLVGDRTSSSLSNIPLEILSGLGEAPRPYENEDQAAPLLTTATHTATLAGGAELESDFRRAAAVQQALEEYEELMELPGDGAIDVLQGAVLIARHRHPLLVSAAAGGRRQVGGSSRRQAVGGRQARRAPRPPRSAVASGAIAQSRGRCLHRRS